MKRGLVARLQAMREKPRPLELAFVACVLAAVFLYLPVSLTFGRGMAKPRPYEAVDLGLPSPPFVTKDIDPKDDYDVPKTMDRQGTVAYVPSGRNVFAYGTPPTPPPTPTPTGACCTGPSTETDCKVGTRDECRGENASYRGDGSTCRPSTCEPPPPPPPPAPPTPTPWEAPAVKLYGFVSAPTYTITCLKDDKENTYVARLGDVVQIKREGQPTARLKISKINLDSIVIANPDNPSQVQTLKLVSP